MRLLALTNAPSGGSSPRGSWANGIVALPVELAGPARHRPAPVALAPDRHAAGRDEADVAGGIGIQHVLHRRAVAPGGGDERRPVAGGAETEQRLDADVVLCERGPAQRQHLIALEHGARRRRQQVGQHGAVPGLAYAQGLGLGAVHQDDLVADRERRKAVRRQILRGVVRIDPLDEQVLGVGAGVGEAPGDLAVVAQHHPRQARHGGADQLALGRLEMGEIPGAGRAQAQMRVVGEQRRAARGAAAIQHPGVRAQARRRRRRQHGGERIGRQRCARARPG